MHISRKMSWTFRQFSPMCRCMDVDAPRSKASWVEPAALVREESWDPLLFVRDLFWSSHLHRARPLHSISSQVLEGLRVIDERSEATVFRSGSISPFDLAPASEQWAQHASADERAIRPGDLVVKRIAPLVAAVAPPHFPSLLADANLIMVRGLSSGHAWWIAFCLNHPDLGDYLLSKSGRGVLNRVGLSVLRSWQIYDPPASFRGLAQLLSGLCERRALVASQIAALKAEVEVAVGELMKSSAYQDLEDRFSQAAWSFDFPSWLFGRSWVPHHVAREFCARYLKKDADWRPLRAFLTPDEPSRERFSELPRSISTVRLGNVSSVSVLPPAVEGAPGATSPRRIFREPIREEEVLLSTLGSSSRVAFSPTAPAPAMFPVDHWARLRFESFPAAFALILQTSPVARQLRNLATGTVQQFVKPKDVMRLLLPVFPEETLANWDRSFRVLARSWQQVDANRQEAIRDGWRIFQRFYLSSSGPCS